MPPMRAGGVGRWRKRLAHPSKLAPACASVARSTRIMLTNCFYMITLVPGMRSNDGAAVGVAARGRGGAAALLLDDG